MCVSLFNTVYCWQYSFPCLLFVYLLRYFRLWFLLMRLTHVRLIICESKFIFLIRIFGFIFSYLKATSLAMRAGSGNIGSDSEMKLEPSSPTEKYTFSRCGSTGSVNTPSSSAHNTGKRTTVYYRQFVQSDATGAQ